MTVISPCIYLLIVGNQHHKSITLSFFAFPTFFNKNEQNEKDGAVKWKINKGGKAQREKNEKEKNTISCLDFCPEFVIGIHRAVFRTQSFQG